MTTHDRDKIIAAAKEADSGFTGDESFNLGTSLVGLEAIDDPRTDLTMTMSEVIVEQKQQHAAALAACKAKDDIILEVLECASTTRPPVRLREALAIQPDDSALKAWLGEPVAYVDDAGCCWMAKLGRQNGKPLYARKEQK